MYGNIVVKYIIWKEDVFIMYGKLISEIFNLKRECICNVW